MNMTQAALMTLLSLGQRSAADGIGSVFVTGLGALAAMALIYGVLELINRTALRRSRMNKDSTENPPESGDNHGSKQFIDVLTDEVNKRGRGGGE